MPVAVPLAIAGASVAGGAIASNAQKSSAKKASAAQQQAADKGVEEQRRQIEEQKRQFEEVQKLLAPYAQAGQTSLNYQQQLLGLQGNQAQQGVIDQIKNSSQFNELNRQGQDAILQNASATGGLRGGNVQGALSQFSPALLQSLIDKQFANLGGLTSIGQNAAAMTGNAGMQAANAGMQAGQNISNLYQQAGAAQAGNYLAQGKATSNMANSIAGGVGLYAGLRNLNLKF
jgi:hypothetical protein